MKGGTQQVTKMIRRSVRKLTATQAFRKWFAGANANDGDLVVINNSFIYRKPLIETSKNEQYLCLRVEQGKVDSKDVSVCRPGDLDSDFKLFSAKSENLPPLESLDKAVDTEVKGLGRLIFVIIGELKDVPAEVSVNVSSIQQLKFDPSAAEVAIIKEASNGRKAIFVNQLTDPESAWNAIKQELAKCVGSDLTPVGKAFAEAFKKLQDEARIKLVLPTPTTARTNKSFIASLRDSISKQRGLYGAAIQKWKSGADVADNHLREIMRIAYNFADDAIKVLQLLISIADLKGVLLWCTIKEHFDVVQAFRNLPWTKNQKKPSLEEYRKIIGGARNRAFHNLLAFDRTIEADLEGVNVNARRLTLLPAHGSRKRTVPLDYEDREMVEILAELTRAPEVAVPFNFWQKNAVVMKSLEKLLESTENALWTLNRVRRSSP